MPSSTRDDYAVAAVRPADPARRAAHYPAWDDAYAAHLIEVFGVRLQRKIGTLSKGETAAAAAPSSRGASPPLLLLDEPTDGLDPVARNRTLALLAEHLADTPTTVVIATHHILEVESLADHVGVLRDGRLVAQMTRDETAQDRPRYRVEVPEGSEPPPELRITEPPALAGRPRSAVDAGRRTRRRDGASHRRRATVRDMTPLTLEEAALAFLAEEASA